MTTLATVAIICAILLTLAWWLRSYSLTIAGQQRDDSDRHLRMALDAAEQQNAATRAAVGELAGINKRLKEVERVTLELSNTAALANVGRGRR